METFRQLRCGRIFEWVFMLAVFLACSALLPSAAGESEIHMEAKAKPLRFCSFFNNRAPKAQPGLRNCTWFKEESCCLQQEIAATFGRVKPLKGASIGCQKYINYLMCYICAPNQNIFYQNERLTVCSGFCNNLFDACGSAILKGSVIRDLYSSGDEFCRSRRFRVSSENCFTFDDIDLGTSSSQAPGCSPLLVLLTLVFWCGPSCAAFLLEWFRQSLTMPRQAINTGCGKQGAPEQSTGDASTGDASPLDAGREEICRNVTRTIGGRCSSVMYGLNLVMYHRLSCVHLYILLLLSLNNPTVIGYEGFGKTARLNIQSVQDWAQLVSEDLSQFAEEGLRHEELQAFYDDAQYVTEYINGTDKLMQVREKLGM